MDVKSSSPVLQASLGAVGAVAAIAVAITKYSGEHWRRIHNRALSGCKAPIRQLY